MAAQDTGTGDTSRAPAVQFFGLSAVRSTPVPVDASRVALLRRRITLAFEGITLEHALAEIARSGHLRFAYSGADVPLADRVTLHADDMTLAAVLTEVLIDARVDVVLTAEDQLTLVRRGQSVRPAAAPPTAAIVGFVTDSGANTPIEAAEVYIDSLHVSALTNRLGRYRLAVPAGRYRGRGAEDRLPEQQRPGRGARLHHRRGRLHASGRTYPDAGSRHHRDRARSGATNSATPSPPSRPIRLSPPSRCIPSPSCSSLGCRGSRPPHLRRARRSDAAPPPRAQQHQPQQRPHRDCGRVRIYADQSDARANNLAVVDPLTGKPIHGENPNTGTSL